MPTGRILSGRDFKTTQHETQFLKFFRRDLSYGDRSKQVYKVNEVNHDWIDQSLYEPTWVFSGSLVFVTPTSWNFSEHFWKGDHIRHVEVSDEAQVYVSPSRNGDYYYADRLFVGEPVDMMTLIPTTNVEPRVFWIWSLPTPLIAPNGVAPCWSTFLTARLLSSRLVVMVICRWLSGCMVPISVQGSKVTPPSSPAFSPKSVAKATSLLLSGCWV